MSISHKSLVLIVDDIPTNIQFICDILFTIPEIEAVGLPGGEETLEFVKIRTPDLILLDIAMPKMDGFEVCNRLKQMSNLKEVPVIFLTAKVQRDDILKAFEMGAVDYISKPFNLNELISRIKTHLELRNKSKQLSEINNALEVKVKLRTSELSHLNEHLSISNQNLQEANQKLSLLDNAKSDFIAHINHELRTPLNGILGNTSLLAEMSLNTEARSYINSINFQVNKLIRMTEITLLFTELHLVNNDLNLKKVSVNEIIHNSYNSSELSSKNIKIEYTRKNDFLEVMGELRLLTSCLSVIMDNAIKYSPNNSKIDVTITFEGSFLCITINDNGPGFTELAKKTAFDLFYADNLDHRSHGLGIGLSSAKKIADMMGGKIKIANNSDKPGASVSLYLQKV